MTAVGSIPTVVAEKKKKRAHICGYAILPASIVIYSGSIGYIILYLEPSFGAKSLGIRVDLSLKRHCGSFQPTASKSGEST